MPLDLSTIAIREPAVLIRDPGGTPSYFWSKNAFELKPIVEYFNVEAAVHATPEKRIKSVHWEINTQLVGEFEYLSYLYPALSASLGSSVLGTTDVAWRLITMSGRQWDFPRGGITKRPMLRAKVGDTLFGDCTFVACCASDKDAGESGAFFTYSTGNSFPNFASFDPTKILTLAPVVTYGSLLSNARTESGVEFEFGWETKPTLDNGLIRDWTVVSQEFTAKLKPCALDFEDLVTACGLDLAMGARLPTSTLIASYTGFYAALRGATVEQASFRFHASEDFIQGLVFRASQTYATNAQVAPGYIATSAPA